MEQFEHLKTEGDLRFLIKKHFDINLEIGGGWGYSKEEATVIYGYNTLSLSQFQHTFASIRAYGEMNMALQESQRYGSINLNERSRETVNIDTIDYECVTYEVSAMKESDYAKFIAIYKEGYGTLEFDIKEHFASRKEATLKREVVHWFELQNIRDV